MLSDFDFPVHTDFYFPAYSKFIILVADQFVFRALTILYHRRTT
jgi:hypothetical protein